MTLTATTWMTLVDLLDSYGFTLDHLRRSPMRIGGEWIVEVLA